MKKLFIFIAIAMVIVMLTSGMSHIFEFWSDSDNEDKGPVYDSNTFYYYDGNELKSTTDISSVDDRTEGFFIINGVTYFAMKFTGDEAYMTWFSATSSSGNYELCNMTSNDMKYVVPFEEGASLTITGSILFVYYCLTDCEDPLEVYEALDKDVELLAQLADPPVTEGPSAA